MSGKSGRWSDLALRVVSGVVLAAIGLGAVWVGGYTFICFVSLLCGVIIWELARMLAPEAPGHVALMGVVAGACSLLAIWFPAALVIPTLLIPVILGWNLFPEQRRLFIPFLVFILVAGFGMSSVRNEFGFVWMLWLVLVVAGTDIAGYFAGRVLGGPKLWPAVSPGKTWSGAIAGWIGALIVGIVFMQMTGSGLWLPFLSVAASIASQAGDLAESAVKRRAGVKDSSQLIPGHGGLFDRFDGMLGASLLVLSAIELTGYPPGPL